MIKFAVRVTLILWPSASILESLIDIFTDRGNQWDLRNYLGGVKAFVQGQNPYTNAIFIYPPLYLPLLKWITTPFTYDQLYVALITVKIFGFVALLWFWKRYFLRALPWHLFMPIVWLGFFCSFDVDIYAGNISTFETGLLFCAFLCYVEDRLYSFAFLVALASTLKLAPIFFLVALFVRGAWRPLVAGAGAFALFLAVNFAVYPIFTRSFFVQAWSRTQEHRLVNPSAFALLKDALPATPAALPFVLWFVFALTIYAISWRAWHAKRESITPMESILFLVLVYTITGPRMKDYAYMLALPSALFAVQNFKVRRSEWVLAAPLLMMTFRSSPSLFEIPAKLFWGYYPWFVAVFFWSLYIAKFKGSAEVEAGA